MLSFDAILFVAILLPLSVSGAQHFCQVEAELGHFNQVFKCEGSTSWFGLQELWCPLEVTVSCKGQSFEVYTASNLEALGGKHVRKRPWHIGAWLPSNSTYWRGALSPLKDTYIGVVVHQGLALSRDANMTCDIVYNQQMRWHLPALGLVGVMIFHYAPGLTSSTTFRVGMGTVVFVLATLLGLLFILMRQHVNGKVLVASTMVPVAWSTAWRFYFGTWLPSLGDLVTNPWVVGFLTLLTLAGMALSYLWDNPENVKMNNIIRVALELVGLALISCSTTVPEVSAALAAALAAWYYVLAPLLRKGYWLVSRIWGHPSRHPKPAMGPTPMQADPGIRHQNRRMEADHGTAIHPKTPAPHPPHNRGAPTHGRSSSPDEGSFHSIVRRGQIMVDGKIIDINSLQYRQLIRDHGYTPDWSRGVMLPPDNWQPRQ